MGVMGIEELKKLSALAPKAAQRASSSTAPAPNGCGDYSTLDVLAWFQAHPGHYGRPRPDGKHTVLCPWSGEHSDEQGADDPDTVVWLADGGWPTFHCSHNHCRGRTIQSVMDLWGDADNFCSARFERLESWPAGGGVTPHTDPFTDEVALVQMPACFPEVGGVQPKITEGREDKLRATAAGLRRSGLSESAIYSALVTTNQELCDPPLADQSVQQIAESVSQFEPSEAQDWRVNAASDAFTGIDPVRKIGTDPPRYEVTVRGDMLEISARELHEWKGFKFACFTKLNYVVQLPPPANPKDNTSEQARWEKEILGPAIERMKKRGQFEEAPEDAGERGAAWQDVLAFFAKKRLTEDRDEVVNDRLWLDNGEYHFRGRALRQWLADNKLDRLDPGDLWDVVRKQGGKPYNLRVKPTPACPKGQVSVWRVPDPAQQDARANRGTLA